MSQISLHNMRGSNEGTKMVIASTIRGLAEEIWVYQYQAFPLPVTVLIARLSREARHDWQVIVLYQSLKTSSEITPNRWRRWLNTESKAR